MPAAHPLKSNGPNEVKHTMRLLGANGADLTIEYGPFIKSVARTGEGAYRITWQHDPGTIIGLSGFGFMAATPGDLKGYTVVIDTPMDTTNLTLDFVVYDSTFTAADLIAAQYLTLTLAFNEYGN